VVVLPFVPVIATIGALQNRLASSSSLMTGMPPFATGAHRTGRPD
jgi:hypothetical protein